MAKDKKETPELMITVTEFPTLTGDQFGTEIKYTKGTAQFSSLVFPVEMAAKTESPTKKREANNGLDWQRYSELGEDHGLSLMYQVLFDYEASTSQLRDFTKLSNSISEKIGDLAWQELEENIKSVGEDNGRRTIYLQAVWSQLFADPYEELWLASMAQHAYYILEDDYAFGYFTALLDQKRNNEEHFLRGKKSVESAKLGGQATARKQSPKTALILQEMQKCINGGHTIKRSAELTFGKGMGRSAEANRKLWTRRPK